MKTQFTPVRMLTISAIVMAMYIAIMFVTQSFAFFQVQIRVATGLYALGALFPFLILPLGLANLLSNFLLGGLGPLDMFGGFLMGILTTGGCYLVKKIKLNDWFIVCPIILIPGLCVPIWLSYLLELPYFALAISLLLGQVIPSILGVLLYKALYKRRGTFYEGK